MKRSNKTVQFVLLMFLILSSRNVYPQVPYKTTPVILPSYHYDAKGKPDPFKPFVEKEMALQKKKERKVSPPIFPLQRLSLEEIKLVGIAENGRKRLAIVETLEGNKHRSYPIMVGTVMGLNRGKVIEIGKDRIIIEEVAISKTGKKINRIVKRLHHDEEEVLP